MKLETGSLVNITPEAEDNELGDGSGKRIHS